MDADTQAHAALSFAEVNVARRREHGKGEAQRRGGVVRPARQQPRGGHVAVANRFHLHACRSG